MPCTVHGRIIDSFKTPAGFKAFAMKTILCNDQREDLDFLQIMANFLVSSDILLSEMVRQLGKIFTVTFES